MARKKEICISIDKLKICLEQPENTFLYLKDHYSSFDKERGTRFLDFDNFFLLFTEEDETSMTALLYLKLENKNMLLGTFVFNNSKKYLGKAFFCIENSALYRQESISIDGNRYNLISFLPYVIDQLGLKFNNITTLEVAVDTNSNTVNKIRNHISDTEKYDMYLNGKKVKENDTLLSGYGEYYSRSRVKLTKTPSLYFHQAKNTDLELRVYNKAIELDENSPEKKESYLKWLGWKMTDRIYRTEIVIRNSNFRDFMKKIELARPELGNYENTLNLLCNENFLLHLFNESIDSLIYFRNRKTKEKISLLDIIES